VNEENVEKQKMELNQDFRHNRMHYFKCVGEGVIGGWMRMEICFCLILKHDLTSPRYWEFYGE
jgi:hypothetical protein